MTIHPFLAGILLTLGVEMLIALILIFHSAYKFYKDNKGDHDNGID